MRSKSEQEKFFGKTISLIQKEWHEEMGDPEAETSEEVMNRGHELLQAAKRGELLSVLNGKSIQEYLGTQWLDMHPAVKAYVDSVLRKKY